jgi:hypothetical protein
VRFSKKKKKKKGDTNRRLPCVGASRRTPRGAHPLLLVLLSCFFLCPLPLLHLCTLFPAALITCLALSFDLALLFDCANPCFECSLPRTPHSSTTSRLCFSRQSLLQSFTGSTCWLQLTPVCLVRTDKNLITALL